MLIPQAAEDQQAMQQLLSALAYLGNVLTLLRCLDDVLASDASVHAFVLAAPLLGIAPDDSAILRQLVSCLHL